MKVFRIILVSAAAVAALWFVPACDGTKPLFESTNLDPHPPEIRNLRVGTVELDFENVGVVVDYTYFDPGEDIEEVIFIDLGVGSEQAENIVEPGPADRSLFFTLDDEGEEVEADLDEVAFFPGETGERQELFRFESPLVGRHVYKMYLVDSKETRSAEQYFFVARPDPR